jgi:hypothetical protein
VTAAQRIPYGNLDHHRRGSKPVAAAQKAANRSAQQTASELRRYHPPVFLANRLREALPRGWFIHLEKPTGTTTFGIRKVLAQSAIRKCPKMPKKPAFDE